MCFFNTGISHFPLWGFSSPTDTQKPSDIWANLEMREIIPKGLINGHRGQWTTPSTSIHKPEESDLHPTVSQRLPSRTKPQSPTAVTSLGTHPCLSILSVPVQSPSASSLESLPRVIVFTMPSYQEELRLRRSCYLCVGLSFFIPSLNITYCYPI